MNAELLLDELRRVTLHAPRLRADGTIEAWFVFDQDNYCLGWLIDTDRGAIRRLLDYDGWIECGMSVLATVERAERELTRQIWTDTRWWCVNANWNHSEVQP